MKQHHSIKIIAASLLTAASLQAFAGLGSLSVHSALGEPFSGSIVVTGEEAKVLLSQKGAARVGGAPLRVSVSKQGNNAVVHLRSSRKINDPLLSFTLSVGQQGRQYTALLDPAEYRRPAPVPRTEGRVEKRTAPERDRKAHVEQKGKKAAAPAKSGGSSANVVFTGQQYTPEKGENLIDIAQKVQPEGLTLRQTVNALVKANPRAFRNGNPDFMYRDVTLVIPTAEQMRQLAQPGADVRRIAQQSAAQQPAAEAKPPVTPPAETAPPPAETAPMPQAPAPQVPPTAASQTMPEMPPAGASAPELPASAEMPVMTSDPETVPVAPPQSEAQPPAQPEPQAAEGNFFSDLLGDNWYLYLGGAAALLLLLVGLLLNKRRQGGNAAEAAAPAAPVLPAGGTAADDEDDIVFESGVPNTAAPVATAPAAQAPAAPAPTAPQAAQDGDEWDWLADAAQQSQDRLGDTKLTADNAAAAAAAAGAAAAQPAASAVKADEDWMSFEAAPQAAVPESAPAAEAAVEEDEWVWIEDDSAAAAPAVEAVAGTDHSEDWSAAAFAVDTAAPVAADEFAAPVVGEIDDIAWLETAEPAVDAPVAETAAAAVPAADAIDDLAWLNDEADTAADVPTADTAAAEVAVAEAGLSWDEAPAFDESEAAAPRVQKGTEPTANAVQRQAFATSGQDLAVVDLDWEALDEPAAEPAEPQEIQITEDVFNFDDLSLEETAVQTPAVTEPPLAAEPVPAPVSETATVPADAAQLKVPMEAKLELAQMYLEIDDAQTARKTLQELVEEADGEVLAKARSLLQQLGA